MDFGKRMTTKVRTWLAWVRAFFVPRRSRVVNSDEEEGLRVPQARRARSVLAIMKTIPFSTKSDKFTPLSRKFTLFFDKFKTLQSAKKTSTH